MKFINVDNYASQANIYYEYFNNELKRLKDQTATGTDSCWGCPYNGERPAMCYTEF